MRGESIVAIYYYLEWSGEKGTKCNTVHGVVGNGDAFFTFFPFGSKSAFWW